MNRVSSVAKKFWMSLAGLFLISFLCVHLAGNLLLFKGDDGVSFNLYSEFMETNILIRIIEIVLFGGFILHIVLGLILTLINRNARPVQYAVNDPAANTTWFSRNMGITGSIVLFFLIVHLKNFMIDQRFLHDYPSMFDSVKATLENTGYFLFYVFCIAWLGLHLAHGFQSSFQSLGIDHPTYTPIIKWAGAIFSIVICAGFIAIPIYFYLGGS